MGQRAISWSIGSNCDGTVDPIDDNEWYKGHAGSLLDDLDSEYGGNIIMGGSLCSAPCSMGRDPKRGKLWRAFSVKSLWGVDYTSAAWNSLIERDLVATVASWGIRFVSNQDKMMVQLGSDLDGWATFSSENEIDGLQLGFNGNSFTLRLHPLQNCAAVTEFLAELSPHLSLEELDGRDIVDFKPSFVLGGVIGGSELIDRLHLQIEWRGPPDVKSDKFNFVCIGGV